MIGYISGTVINKQERAIIVDVNGVGYQVFIDKNTLERVQNGDAVQLHIHTHVREDEISLYGFPSQNQWQLFKLLISVSGIGPKSALEILKAPYEKVCIAIATKNISFLTQIQGIGKKTAERLIVDLQNKVQQISTSSNTIETANDELTSREDLVDALISLGYKRQQVLLGLRKVPAEIAGDEAIIKYFLQNT